MCMKEYILLEDVEGLLLVDGSHIDGSRLGLVDQLTEDDSISNCSEQVL
jgi:hypothetical protein